MERQLDELLASTSEIAINQIIGDAKVRVLDITHDSSKVSNGVLFCCIVGENVDGHNFAKVAAANGAAAILVERRVEVDITQVVVSDVRSTMGYLAAELFNRPSEKLNVIGITGTNGKTTTAHLLASILRQHGWPTSVLGTLTGTRTTPESTDLQRFLAEELNRGSKAVVMEVSSHALALGRVEGTLFKAAVFTNLGQDHLDFHKSIEDYFAAKARLFTRLFTNLCVINRDDVHGSLLLDVISKDKEVRCESFGMSDAKDIHADASKISFHWQGQKIDSLMGGYFNVMNALAAATAAAKLGVTVSDIAKGLAAASAVPGRFESVSEGQLFSVVVDYAHTPEALQNVLLAGRKIVGKDAQVILVFGCGGGRDQLKRPKMGDIASQFADLVYVTSDNPRHEDARTIAHEVLQGVSSVSSVMSRVTIELDRRLAIGAAFGSAKPGDIVIIAGKGHEATQTIGADETPFSDVQVSRELLKAVS
ncbi:MAG: UDP-N-acetylmuramoyl-L-alanyl-D-glutamate--2,6-diaminopimelate ligase [Ilumatobacteraceae bacterium]|nr:UDP-N-acetylmuramoyl-L-alanyl-D-glutamate--2,6-diaminopimelate ligase [Ilumatobacteraceae bacterium]